MLMLDRYTRCVCLDEPVTSEPIVCEEPEDDSVPTITIDGEKLEIGHVYPHDGGALISADGREYVVFPDRETAGEAARAYWRSLAKNDTREFICLVGEGTLIAWALGQPAGPGYRKVCSLQEWLDYWAENPEEHWSSWDGSEYEVDEVNIAAVKGIGFAPEVAYRHS
ncbi:MAG: hypothetical protein AMK75_02570 [Planctomycetes bacterium SM23_65]|nr:MAG: hypothetical protein AMK75_02570 [Planctomycetes bacterium SM23_65]